MSGHSLMVQSLPDLLAQQPTPDQPVVEGLLRRGEILNVIAPPKVGKSLLVAELAMALTTGTPWLGCATVANRSLILDNELRPAQYACRCRALAIAHPGADLSCIDVVLLRGSDSDFCTQQAQIVEAIRGTNAGVLILDSLYRALPLGSSENDPTAVLALYRMLVRVATDASVAVVIVHHATKGSQGRRGVTDVGAGAGAVARVADSHLILREHAEDDYFIVEAAVRSWPEFPPRVVSRDKGLAWRVVPEADPGRVRCRQRRRRDPSLPAETIRSVLNDLPQSVKAIASALSARGAVGAMAGLREQLDRMVVAGGVHRSAGDRGTICYGLVPVLAISKTEQVIQALQRQPGASAAEIARQVGCDAALVRRALRQTTQS